MFRFSRDKLFFNRVTFEEFFGVCNSLSELVRARHPGATIEILTFEPASDPKYRAVRFISDSTMNVPEHLSYRLDQFTDAVWRRATEVQLTVKDPADKNSVMICVSCYPQSAKHLFFYGQDVDETLFSRICAEFARPDYRTRIGARSDRDSIIGAVKATQAA